MPPKNKGKAAGKSKDTSDDTDSGKKGGGAGKLKPATAINVRHILCEKHSKKEEAMEKLRNGAKFDEVAREMSEDKARQGKLLVLSSKPIPHLSSLYSFQIALDLLGVGAFGMGINSIQAVH